MNENQVNSSDMQVDPPNSENIYFSSPRKNPETREEYDQETNFPNFPNQALEALTVIKNFLSQQISHNEIKITKDGVIVNEKPFEVNYESCRICKNEPSQLICSECERKVCPNCVASRNSNDLKCVRCKNAQKAKNNRNS